MVAQNTDPRGRGRPSTEYWLNEAQALLIVMRSDTARPPAADDLLTRIGRRQ